MNPSNRFSKDLLGNIRKPPKSRTSYKYMSELFPYINDYLRLNENKITQPDHSNNKSNYKHKLNNNLYPSNSKKLKLSHENSDIILPLDHKAASKSTLNSSKDSTTSVKKESTSYGYKTEPSLLPQVPDKSLNNFLKPSNVRSSQVKKEPFISACDRELPSNPQVRKESSKNYNTIPGPVHSSKVKKEPIISDYNAELPQIPQKSANDIAKSKPISSSNVKEVPISGYDKQLPPNELSSNMSFQCSNIVIKQEPLEESNEFNSSISESTSFRFPLPTNMIKQEPVDNMSECVENSFSSSNSVTRPIKKELKTEPDENLWASTQLELNIMTSSLLKIFIKKELPENLIYASFLKLCDSENVANINMTETPSLATWKINLYHFMRRMLQKHCRLPPNELALPYSDMSLEEYYKYFMKYYESGGFYL